MDTEPGLKNEPVVSQTRVQHAYSSPESSVCLNIRSDSCGAVYGAMFGLLLIGLLAAVGHDLFYVHLNSREIQLVSVSQTWVIRIGNMFAFLFKLALAAAISVVYAQGFWFVTRQQVIQTRCIDNMFNVISNPASFFDRRFLSSSTRLVILAALCWTVPLSAVLSPGTLTVVIAERQNVGIVPVPILGSLTDDHGLDHGPGSIWIRQISVRVMGTGELISWPSPCGVNCSYTISFAGPAYECLEVGPLWSLWAQSVNLTQLSIQAPNRGALPFLNSSVYYWGLEDWGNETSPVRIWVVVEQLNRTISCTLYNATYTTTISYINNVQTVQNLITRHNTLNGGAVLYSVPTTDYQQFALNLLLIHEAAAQLLRGAVYSSFNSAGLSSQASYWAGIAKWSRTGYVEYPDDLPLKLEDFIANVTISLIDLRNYGLSDVPGIVVDTVTPAKLLTHPAIYVYARKQLWQIYGTALGISSSCVLLGCYMLYKNETPGFLSFSNVLSATRNPTLDALCSREGTTEGSTGFTTRLLKTGLMYGKLKETDHQCFGTETDIVPLRLRTRTRDSAGSD